MFSLIAGVFPDRSRPFTCFQTNTGQGKHLQFSEIILQLDKSDPGRLDGVPTLMHVSLSCHPSKESLLFLAILIFAAQHPAGFLERGVLYQSNPRVL